MKFILLHRSELLELGSRGENAEELGVFSIVDVAESIEHARKHDKIAVIEQLLSSVTHDSTEYYLGEFDVQVLLRGLFEKSSTYGGEVFGLWHEAIQTSFRPEHSARLIQLSSIDKEFGTDLVIQSRKVYALNEICGFR